MSELTKVLIDIATTKIEPMCIYCGGEVIGKAIICPGCSAERYAERVERDREYSREVYGPDVANGD